MSQKTLESGAAASAAAPSPLKRVVELPFGYQDKEDPTKKHTRVVIGKRPIARDLFDAPAGSDVQWDAVLQAGAITEFGEMRMPVPISVLLSLNSIDRGALQSEFYRFAAESLGDRESKVTAPGVAELAFGISVNGSVFHQVTFGNLLTGYDEIEIEKSTTPGWQRRVATLGAGIKSVASGTEPGPLTLEQMGGVDFLDLMTLIDAEGQWLDSFRGSEVE